MNTYKAHYLHDFTESHEEVQAPNQNQAETYFKKLARERGWRLAKYYQV